jgi:TPR repeat protein
MNRRALSASLGLAALVALIAVLLFRRAADETPSLAVTVPRVDTASRGSGQAAPKLVALRTSDSPSDAEPRSAIAGKTEEQQRSEFIRGVRAGDIRTWLGEGVPLHVVRLFAAGRMREGAQILIRMGREGDANGYAALRRLLSVCPGPGGDRDFERGADSLKVRNDAMIENAKLRGTPPDVLKRLRWSLDAGNANKRGVWAEFCPGPGPERGDAQAILAEVHTVLPEPIPEEVRQRLRDMDTDERAEAMRKLQPRVEAAREQEKTLESELARAQRRIYSQDPEERAAALERLLEMAESSPKAKHMLAVCLRSRCVPDAGGPEEALSLYLEAARAGSIDSMYALSRNDPADPFSARSRDPLLPSSADRYGWLAVREELIAHGCYGLQRFATWGFNQPPQRPPLAALSPADAEAAQARASEMIRTEVPGIRAAIGCD